MSQSSKADLLADSARHTDCPCWCVIDHDSARGEDDWVHEGAPLVIENGVLARLCMSVDPERGVIDGPFVLIGTRELAVEEAEALGVSFIGLAVAGAASIRREADEKRSPGP